MSPTGLEQSHQAATISIDEIKADATVPGQPQDEDEWEYEYSTTETEVL